MKKKRWAVLGFAIMLMSMAVLPVQAGDVTVNYRVANRYIVTIPDSIDLSKGAVSSEVSVSGVALEPNASSIRFQITNGVGENGVIELSEESDTANKGVTTISTTKNGAGIAPNTDFVSFTEDGAQTLYFTALESKDGKTVKPGTYSTTITFTVNSPGRW